MTLEEYKQWMRDLYEGMKESELSQLTTRVLELNEERASRDVELKKFLRDAYEVWRMRNVCDGSTESNAGAYGQSKEPKSLRQSSDPIEDSVIVMGG